MEKLKKIFVREDTVLFIGSGISLWSGLPTWGGLIDELSEFLRAEGFDPAIVDQEKKRGDLLQAASYAFDKLTPPQIGEFIRQACRYGKAEPHEIHKKIVSLGPKCFITTNYDNLVERALQKWQSDSFYPSPVNNRHLTEMANIVEAKATNYIFKPHGDASDIESIVLTREQYRRLLPQGGSHSALETLKMIMTTRPVVYLGFGLRDPDFLYLRDLLANTFNGSVRDHYAIMPNVSQEEKDYWKKNYGIHLISYTSTWTEEKGSDHSAILDLLDNYLEIETTEEKEEDFDPKSSATMLNILRYTSGLTRFVEKESEFEIRVSSKKKMSSFYRINEFRETPVNKFLTEGPVRAILTGLPGAGKTYSIKKALSTYGKKLNQECLSADFDIESATIPLFGDFKLYKGNIEQLISQSLPPDLPLEKVLKHYKVKIFFDSFNEMPKEYWDNNSYEVDLTAFIKKNATASIIIGSRTSDGLDKLDFSIYALDLIEWKIVKNILKEIGIKFEGKFVGEMHTLLQRPFYFQYIVSKKIVVPPNAHPKDFYKQFFRNISAAFEQKFGKSFDMEAALAISAYNTLNKGEETLLLTDLLQALKKSLEKCNIENDAREIANWLISSDVLIPYSGGRLAFVHQSITEYLASLELARQYMLDNDVVFEKLAFTRWDQALFLTLSHLDEANGKKFLSQVIKSDFILALTATKYLEFDTDPIVKELLLQMSAQHGKERRSSWLYEEAIENSLPIREVHVPILYQLLDADDGISSGAAKKIVEFKGAEVKDEMLALLLKKKKKYSYLMTMASVLSPLLSDEDKNKLLEHYLDEVDKVSEEEDIASIKKIEEDNEAFLSFLGIVLHNTEISSIKNRFLQDIEKNANKLRLNALNSIIYHSKDVNATNFAAELLLLGCEDASFTIYMADGRKKENDPLDWQVFSLEHISKLLEFSRQEESEWSRKALMSVCRNRADLANLVNEEAEIKIGLEKVFLHFCTGKFPLEAFFDTLANITRMSKVELTDLKMYYLHDLGLSWENRSELFVAILEMCDARTLDILTMNSLPASVISLGEISPDVIKILDWMNSIEEEEYSWTISRIGSIVGIHASSKCREQLIDILNNGEHKYRSLILERILVYTADITTDIFSEHIISYLLADLKNKQSDYFMGNILSRTATEEFINSRLLPLLNSKDEPFLKNLSEVIRQAGIRHGKRFLFLEN